MRRGHRVSGEEFWLPGEPGFPDKLKLGLVDEGQAGESNGFVGRWHFGVDNIPGGSAYRIEKWHSLCAL